MAWLLLIALPLHGNTSLLLQLLGPTHRHAAPMVAPVHGHGAHGHSHDHLARHHHDAHDHSVILHDAGDPAPDAALAVMGSLMLVSAPTAGPVPVPVPGAPRSAPWPRDRAAAWSSHTPPPIERPPQAA